MCKMIYEESLEQNTNNQDIGYEKATNSKNHKLL